MIKPDVILRASEDLHETIRGFRRHLHQFPELSHQEFATADFVAQQLTSWGIPHTKGIGGTGIVALIRGKKPNARCVALRADMDALPIQEANEVPYKSQHPGVMHACGHDVHTASLLGACHILQGIRADFEGTVKCIFQPAEEKLPSGAEAMIRQGVLRRPNPTHIIGQHVHPPLHVGKVGFRAGPYMASADEIRLRIKGRGGHAALPHNCIDPIAISAQILTALQQVVSRFADPTSPSVLTFGSIRSVGGATNVIPDEVLVEGTFRAMNEAWRKEAHSRIKKLAQGIAKSLGGACDIQITLGPPVLNNDEALTRASMEKAVQFLGKNQVEELPIRMTAEDFAFYSHQIPSCFYRLGTGNAARGITAPIHNSRFDIDEDALVVGSGLMAWLAVSNG